MPDITMCNTEKCPLRDTCYRAQAEPNPLWQAYSTFKYDMQNGKPVCGYFSEIRPRSQTNSVQQ